MSSEIGFNDTTIINSDDKATLLAMFDKLTRIADGRRILPHDQLNNVTYEHRTAFSTYNLQIGDSYFMIPPEFICVASESTSQQIVTLRQENSMRQKAGSRKRTLLVDLVFNGHEQINGYRVEGPESVDGKDYYVDGLRQMLAQFKCTPFLPIQNEYINGVHGIFVVVLQGITISTVPGFPTLMTAQLTLQEVEMFPYLEMPNAAFKSMIDWDLFRYYYQRFLTERYEYKQESDKRKKQSYAYKKLLSLPVNKEYNNFKISILKESVFTEMDESEIKYGNKNDALLKQICDNDNYDVWVDSSIDDIKINAFQCGYYNILTNIQLNDTPCPTVQFMGGMDTIFNISLETTDENVVSAIEQCRMYNDTMVRNNAKYRSLGFVKLESELVSFTGSLFVVVDNVITSTTPEFPGLYQIQIQCVSFDIGQSARENLNGFLPFDDNIAKEIYGKEYSDSCSRLDDYGYVSDHIHEEQIIEQSMKGLFTKIRQDCYAEWKLRSTMELYPDMYLPTYAEVDEFITKCNAFRASKGLELLPYEKYPTRPECMIQGLPITNNVQLSGDIVYTKDIQVGSEYVGFVDPDFYVFYPNAYQSFELDCYDMYTSAPRGRITKDITISTNPSGDGSGLQISYADETLIDRYIALAHQQIGKPYVYGDEGPNTFDCSGLVWWCLTQIGVLPSNVSRDISPNGTVTGIARSSDFKKVPYEELRRGDCLVQYKDDARTKGLHIVIYVGDNQVIDANSTAGKVVLRPSPGNPKIHDVFRPVAFDIAASTAVTKSTTLEEKQNIMWGTLKALGYTDIAAAGIIGCWTEESRCSPKTIEGDHEEWDTLEKQIEFVNMELSSSYSEVKTKIQEAPNPMTAAAIFCREYEGYELDSTSRQAVAQQVYNRLSGSNGTSYTSNSTSQSTLASKNTITKAEFEAICQTVYGQVEGMREYENEVLGLAQMVYDKITSSQVNIGLAAILNNTDLFPEEKVEDVPSDVEAIVESVFCNGKRRFPDSTIAAYLSPSSTIASPSDFEKMYTKLNDAGQLTFWEKTPRKASSDKIFTIVDGQSTGAASYGNYDSTTTVTYEVNQAELDKFAEPVLVSTDAIMYDDKVFTFWNGKNGNSTKMERARDELNSGANIFGSSFVDEAQYSCRGRLVRAFPTYMFCILDDDTQWYLGNKLWTNYYMRKSVVDIQVHETNDMPTATAVLTVANVYGNLSTKQKGLSGYDIRNDLGGFSKWWYNTTGQVLDFGSPDLTESAIKLKQVIYNNAKIREGARVHIRMGYGSDPLSLAPVMNGTITSVSVGDQLTIVATSDGVELVQHITSATEKTNNGWLGLFGLGEDQESSNLIANILCKRDSIVNYFVSEWFEGSKYGIEHFGLYFNQNALGVATAITDGAFAATGAAIGSIGGLVGTIAGASVGALVGIALSGDVNVKDLWNGYAEQYDICKNLYKANYGREHYIYAGPMEFDKEKNICFNEVNMTPWDVMQIATQQVPEYIVKPSYHQFDSRVYFGIPFWMEKYRYDYLNGTVYEECKASTQVHMIESVTNIIDNQVKVTNKYNDTNKKVIFVRGGTPASTRVIHSDDTISYAKQKTGIIDSAITQDCLGPDALYDFIGYDIGQDAARRVGISNLLYEWQLQYQGEVICTGLPGVKAHDYVLIDDSYSSIAGIAIAREVTHSFSTGTGFTTSITPGMVGFSSDQQSGLIVAIQNYLQLFNNFSNFLMTRNMMKINYEKNLPVLAAISVLEQKEKALMFGSWSLSQIGHAGDTALKIANIAVPIYYIKNAGVTKEIFNFCKACINTKKIAKLGPIASASVNAFKATWARWEDTSSTLKIAQGLGQINRVFSSINAGINATLAAVFPPGFVIKLALSVIIERIVHEVFLWIENRNVCVLLPLWFEGYPFISGVQGQRKLLLDGSGDVNMYGRSTNETTDTSGSSSQEYYID